VLDAREAWTRFDERGARPFTTHALFRRADGAVVTWESRLYRKHHNLLDNHRGTTWWAPSAVGWWIGVRFMVGSACFALGAAPGYLDAVGVEAVGHGWVTWKPGNLSWWIAGLNLVGSVAFGVSSVAAYVIVDSGLAVNAQLANAGTFVWAVCFFVGAFLLLPERTRPTE
jgi:hypothetical protein